MRMHDLLLSEISAARGNGVGRLLDRTAARFPDKTAIVDGAHELSYREFNQSVNRTAHALTERGLSKGDLLALLSPNSWEFVTLVYACAKLGVVLVPINFMLNASEIAYILKDSGADGLVVDPSLRQVAEAALGLAGSKPRIRAMTGAGAASDWDSVRDWCFNGEVFDSAINIGDDDPIRLMYTSGTESEPKGVILTSRSLIAQYNSCALDGEMSSQDIEIHSLPMYHCAQLDCFFSVGIYLGATNIILPTPDPSKILASITKFGANKLFCPPTVWISLLRSPQFEKSDLSTLTKGYYGASAMPVEVLMEIQVRLPQIRLWNFYGQTEMSPVATILKPEEQYQYAGSAGRTSINVETRIVDDDDKQLAAGMVGEIVHRSPHLTLGYFNNAEKTAAAFRNGWFHSGDLGKMTEGGYLYVVDRKKDMIKTGGENVASLEVENAIYAIDEVAEVAVFGVPHPRWIEAVAAAIIIKPGTELSVEQVNEQLKEKLAGYKRPKFVLFVDSLPKNPSGKIVKNELRRMFRLLAQERDTH